MPVTHLPVGSATHHRRPLTSIILALVATALTGLMWLVGWVPAMDRVSGDLILRSSSPQNSRDVPVTVVLIDDSAIDHYGPLPWPRDRLASVIRAVQSAGARGTAIDLILTEPTDPDHDAALAEVLRNGPVALAAAIGGDGSWLLPLNEIGGVRVAAHAYGEVGPDGVVRTIATTKQADGLSLPALSLAAARLLRQDLAIEPGTSMRPEFRPAPQDLMVFSAATALEGQLPKADISNRLVFVGISATGGSDQFIVPTGPRHAPIPGVLAHASAAASILEGRLLHRLGLAWALMAALLLAVGVQLLRDRSGAFDLVRFSLLIVGVCLVALIAFRTGLVLVPVTALIAPMVISALLREAVESRLAHRETGRLLQSMLVHAATPTIGPIPRGARGRLDAIKDLQRRVLSEDATRRALLAGMNEGVVLWDRDGGVLEANPAAAKLWGHVPSYSEISDGRDSGDGKLTHHRRGQFELSVDVTELGSGRLAIVRDITAERTLERRRREMQRLVSHELKTPLASIAGFGETLERYQLSGDELSRVAGMIRGEAGRLQEMVTVFLDLERLGGGHWEDEIESLDLGELVRARLDVLEAAAGPRGVAVSGSIEAGCLVSGVPTLLDRVVDNLVGNAIKYTQSGDRVEVEVRRGDGRAVLSVADHGPGIPLESQEKIFDRFYRVPGTEGAGAGLGLALVREVVDWHGGCMEIDSEPGNGSLFRVSLPASEED